MSTKEILERRLDRELAKLDRPDQHQHTPGWYALMDDTFGGSDVSALMGMNPYKKRLDVIAAKLGLAKWDGGSIACWWGSLFEDVLTRFVEIDCGCTVKGAEMCIQIIKGHRNSPDGFMVLGFTDDGRVWTSDMERDPKFFLICLLEDKCPLTRIPDGKVPRQYVPQVWSGLAVAPFASRGLFADAVIRKCSLPQLGPSAEFDRAFHSRPQQWDEARAWGLTAVYAPVLEAPEVLRFGAGAAEVKTSADGICGVAFDAAVEAWNLYRAAFGRTMDKKPGGVIDFGRSDAQFERVMRTVDKKLFKIEHTDPCFEDSRGSDLRDQKAVDAAIAALRDAAPEHYMLLGVIPWKFFDVVYQVVDPRPKFADELAAMCDSAHEVVREARAAPSPTKFIQELRISARKARPARPARRQEPEDDLSDFFGPGAGLGPVPVARGVASGITGGIAVDADVEDLFETKNEPAGAVAVDSDLEDLLA